MEYRLPSINDKKIILEYIKDHYEHNEKSISASNMLTSMKYEDWVEKIKNNKNIPDADWGRSLTYLAIDNDKLIGLLNIRYELSGDLRMKYGDIGYSIAPTYRRKGYASKMLKYALEVCKELGMKSVILGCYKSNIGSSKVIRKNGGILIKSIAEKYKISEYYEIDLESEYYEIKL